MRKVEISNILTEKEIEYNLQTFDSNYSQKQLEQLQSQNKELHQQVHLLNSGKMDLEATISEKIEQEIETQKLREEFAMVKSLFVPERSHGY